MEFEGTEVFRLKCNSDKSARIKYNGKLESGSMSVYDDCGESKTELFSVNGGDETESSGEILSSDKVYIIVETNEKCRNGDFSFEIIYD